MSDSEEELLSISNAVKYYMIEIAGKTRKFSAHPINTQRYTYGEFHHLYKQLRQHPTKFREYMRMQIETFDFIVLHSSNRIERKWRNCHSRPILAEERLMITIR